MNYKTLGLIPLLVVITISCKKTTPTIDSAAKKQNLISTETQAVSTVPDSEASYFNINKIYYKKYVRLGDPSSSIPIVAGANVSDDALNKAAILCGLLVRTYPSYAVPTLRSGKIYIAIFGNTEYPDVLPGWPAEQDAKRYGGGFGPTSSYRVCGIHEGDILKNSYDRYPTENIVVHEFGHAIKNFALEVTNPSFKDQVATLLNTAIAAGKWNNTYAATNSEEYWAECVQSYFNVNRPGPAGGDGVHNDINTRVKLQVYDPGIYNLVDQVYEGQNLPAGDW